MKFYFHTYGCQMNERDSDAAAALLERRGHTRAISGSDADVVIVNTCSVRGKAEDKAIGKLHVLVAEKKKSASGRLVGVMGCMVQRLQSDLLRKVPGLDFAVGTHRLSGLPAILDRVVADGGPVLDGGEEPGPGDVPEEHSATGICAFVNILLGCDRHCAYCIVPAVRGREWSRPASAVVREVQALADAGVREVTLLGQSVMSYGRRQEALGELVSPRGFVEPLPRLLEQVAAVSGIRRIRFTSGHPLGCTPELARAMAEIPKVCPHLHLPLQSGSDRILQVMRRGYTRDEYRRAVETLRARVPDIALTTDMIVGFPSETEEDFEMTRALAEEIRFDNSFIFKYSPRPGTPAEKMKDDISAEEKMRRNQVLLREQDLYGLAINQRCVGTDVEVLVEGVSLRNKARWAGRSGTNKIVFFDPVPGLSEGDLVRIRIDRVRAQTLYGQVAESEATRGTGI